MRYAAFIWTCIVVHFTVAADVIFVYTFFSLQLTLIITDVVVVIVVVVRTMCLSTLNFTRIESDEK